MLKLTKNRLVFWPVTCNQPEDGGTTSVQKFTVQYKLLPVSEADDIIAGRNPQRPSLLKEVVTGWDGVAEEDGTPIIFGQENLDRLLDVGYVRVALLEAYFQAAAGRAAAKN